MAGRPPRRAANVPPVDSDGYERVREFERTPPHERCAIRPKTDGCFGESRTRKTGSGVQPKRLAPYSGFGRWRTPVSGGRTGRTVNLYRAIERGGVVEAKAARSVLIGESKLQRGRATCRRGDYPCAR